MKCELCNKDYQALQKMSFHVQQTHEMPYKTYYDQFLKKAGEGVCRTCGGATKFYKGKYSKFCSNRCINGNSEVLEKMSKSVKDAFSRKTPKEWADIYARRKKTVKQKYNVDNVSQLEDIREARSENCYLASPENRKTLVGLDWPAIREKITLTNLQRYGSVTPAKSVRVKQKISTTKRKRFYSSFHLFKDVVVPLFPLDAYEGGKKKPYKWKCVVCGEEFIDFIIDGKLPRCKTCYPKIKSNLESIITSFLSENSINFVKNTRTVIPPFELDFYLPDQKLAIELNGLYWHSELSGGKSKNYHLNKTVECEKRGIRLLHIFEDELLFKREITTRKLLQLCGKTVKRTYARKCTIHPVDYEAKKRFLEDNHLQGNDSSSVSLGLFNGSELVSLMTFSKGRKCLNSRTQPNRWELSRFCGVCDMVVVGGASKLLKFFETNYKPDKIVTYADRRWSKGGLYKTLGFDFVRFSPPSYWYFKYGYYDRFHRFSFNKKALVKKLKIFNPELTEWENMQMNGFDRIWDCGTYVFEKNYPTKNVGGAVSAKP